MTKDFAYYTGDVCMTIEKLRDVSFFQALEDDALQLFLNHGTIRAYPRHTVVINEGDDSCSLYIVLDGKLKVYLSDESGREIILGLEGPGGYIGEVSLLDSEPRSASVMTLEKTRCLVISKDNFHECLRNYPDVAIGVIGGLTHRIRSLLGNVRNLGLKNVYRRLVSVLLDMSQPCGEVSVLTEKLTHQDTADMIGASREMVSRILRDLITGGYISVENKSITIHRTPPAGW